jgi:hypothetical protein
MRRWKMGSGTLKVFARTTLVIEIEHPQPWGDDASFKDIEKTAIREATEEVRKVLAGRAVVVGVPSVEAIIVRRQ